MDVRADSPGGLAQAAARDSGRADVSAARPITVLVLALGGEGGGVLGEWIVDTAIAQGLPVQATSVPGVAQRTGATSYYVEMLATPRAELAGRAPVFCLAPTPGELDLVISSELLETARALERGLVDPQRTLLVSSIGRFLTIAEKSKMADGRYDGERVLAAARALGREALFFDMAAESAAARTVLSSVMFGAIAASGVLPLSREACETTVGAGGASAKASLAGFARGFDAIVRAREQADGVDPHARAVAVATEASTRTQAPQTARMAEPANESVDAVALKATQMEHPTRSAPTVKPARQAASPAVSAHAFPPPVREIVDLALPRLREFQDDAYAREYLGRVGAIVEAERAARGDDFVASRTAARFLALWMAYEDVIRVADLKTRPERFVRIRGEVGARDGEPLIVREFLKPGIDEIAAILPAPLASRLRAWGARRGRQTLSGGIRVATSGVAGYLMLRSLAWLRPLRRRSDRFATEQALIGRWQAALIRALSIDSGLAREIAECPRLLKGYGDTFQRGRRNFLNIMETLVEQPLHADKQAIGERAAALRRAREASLDDPEGHALASALGMPPPVPREQPLRFVARAVRRN